MTDALPGWDALLTPAGRERVDAAAAALAAGHESTRIGADLRRAGTNSDEVAAILTQADLRRRASAKFGSHAERMLFTPAGLEQATRAVVAAHHADRFVAAGCRAVADLGCGIGAESLALAAAGIAPYPVELDPFTAAVAAHNLAAAGYPSAEVTVGDAERVRLPAIVDGVFLDPARRTAGHRDTRRITRPDAYSPKLSFAFAQGDRGPAGVKLGPGFDRDLIPEATAARHVEAQWVSVDGQLVETGVWFGGAARPGIGRAALVLRGEHGAGGAGAHELSAPADALDVAEREPGEYLYEPDGAVIRARLIGALAERLGAGMMSERIAYLTGDRLVSTPFAAAFRIVEQLPVREKELSRALAERGVGRLEIKKRGADIDPAELRRRLKLRGPESATLILTRAGERRIALLAERCPET